MKVSYCACVYTLLKSESSMTEVQLNWLRITHEWFWIANHNGVTVSKKMRTLTVAHFITIWTELLFFMFMNQLIRVLRRMADRTLNFQYRPQLGGSFETKVYLKRKVNHANLAGEVLTRAGRKSETRLSAQKVGRTSNMFLSIIFLQSTHIFSSLFC